MYAIVKTGGKQYKVAEGDVIEIEKLDGEPGASVTLTIVHTNDLHSRLRASKNDPFGLGGFAQAAAPDKNVNQSQTDASR